MKKMNILGWNENVVAGIPVDMEFIRCNCDQLFVWASGMHSPLYLDWRSIFSSPDKREVAMTYMNMGIRQYAPSLQAIIGVETSGVPWAADLSRDLHLPFARLKKQAKDHGLKNKLQGRIPPDCQVIGVVEDLISTGGSLEDACQQVEECIPGSTAIGIAVFSYLLPEAEELFSRSEREVWFLTDIEATSRYALERNYFSEKEAQFIQQWHQDPWQYTPGGKPAAAS